MQVSLPQVRREGSSPGRGGWLLMAALGVLLWAPTLWAMWPVWKGDPSLSHAPLVPLIAGAHLWVRRKALQRWDAAATPGFVLLALCALLHVLAGWADVEFMKPLSLVGMLVGGVGYLGGWTALRAAAGPLGFLVFMIPWPTTLVERLAFPLQLTSSAYAAMMGGMFGLPVKRDGVHLAIVPDLNAPPVYSVLVARQCSGLTSLMVLLALGYLVAYHTPVKLGWRALLLASVVPLALFTNAVRITLILMAGAYHSAGLAQWVHDHEAPVLIFFCSIGLMTVRHALLSWTGGGTDKERSERLDHEGPGVRIEGRERASVSEAPASGD